MNLKGLGDKTDPELLLPPLPELSAQMLPASAGKGICAEITCKTAIDKHESIWPLQPTASPLPEVSWAPPFKGFSGCLVLLGPPLSLSPPLSSAEGCGPGEF